MPASPLVMITGAGSGIGLALAAPSAVKATRCCWYPAASNPLPICRKARCIDRRMSPIQLR